jgi:hypothetical protein
MAEKNEKNRKKSSNWRIGVTSNWRIGVTSHNSTIGAHLCFGQHLEFSHEHAIRVEWREELQLNSTENGILIRGLKQTRATITQSRII